MMSASRSGAIVVVVWLAGIVLPDGRIEPERPGNRRRHVWVGRT